MSCKRCYAKMIELRPLPPGEWENVGGKMKPISDWPIWHYFTEAEKRLCDAGIGSATPKVELVNCRACRKLLREIKARA